MSAKTVCDHCGEELGANAVWRGDRVYCCQACAYEAARSKDCGGRADSHMTASIVEPIRK